MNIVYLMRAEAEQSRLGEKYNQRRFDRELAATPATRQADTLADVHRFAGVAGMTIRKVGGSPA